MLRTGVFALFCAATAGMANAGGVERSTQSTDILFEPGNYAELSLGHIAPMVSGVATTASLTPGGQSGEMTQSYAQAAFGYKRSLGNGFDLALVLDQPFGAAVNYPIAQPYFARGAIANLNAEALTGMVKYRFPSNLSLFGGLRYQNLRASATVPFVSDYTVVGEMDDGFGYLAGIAYERPDIALRVALTYNSTITHDLRTTETSTGLGGPNGSNTRIRTPQSINLEFQSGVAENTLVFGAVRWVEWSAFEITPTNYETLTSGGSLVQYADDRVTYTLGIGRKFSDNWSASASISFEESTGSIASNLGPTDGFTALSLGAKYTGAPVEIGFGIRLVAIGDAATTLDGVTRASEFSGNTALAGGITLGYRF